MSWYRWRGTDLVINIYLQPRASRSELVGVQGDALKLRLQAPPVDGKANAALCDFVAGLFGVPRRRVALIAGSRNRHKQVQVAAPPSLPLALTEMGLKTGPNIA